MTEAVQPQPDRPEEEPPARTAGEQSHQDPDEFRGEETDPPADTGKPPQN